MRGTVLVHHPNVDSVLEHDSDVDYYEDDEPLELVREIASRSPELVTTAPLSVLDVASAILQEMGRLDTYRLQKLCYYSQAHYVAEYGTRLFAEPIEAWTNGPVIRALWNRHAGRRVIERLPEGDPAAVKAQPAAADMVHAVLEQYGSWTGQQLSEMTHRERPWTDARGGLRAKQPAGREIPVEVLRDYYRGFAEIEPVDEPPSD